MLPMLLACQPQARTASAGAGLSVLEVSASAYQPAAGARSDAGEAAACKAWSLNKQQVAAVFDLSRDLREGELHDYDWLPCSIQGSARVQGKIWQFEINAAGTSTWRAGNQTRLMGCSQAACESLVILMPDGQGS